MESKVTHFLYVPFTGLGLYNGHRGKRWLRNRIQIFKQFVVPSLLEQTNQNFIIWVSWRYEDKRDADILNLKSYLIERFGLNRVVFTYAGVCFWDDKYPDNVAYERLISAVHGSMGDLQNIMGEADTVLMTIQPSDDVYHLDSVDLIQKVFEVQNDVQVFGFSKGYVMDYTTLKLAEWNPATTPPFYTIKFPRKVFADPLQHLKYTGPYKSHEYVKDYLKAIYSDHRYFVVGTHGENISTVFDHPYAGAEEPIGRLVDFGLGTVKPLALPYSLRKRIFNKFPYQVKRKLRYWAEKNLLASAIYKFMRS